MNLKKNRILLITIQSVVAVIMFLYFLNSIRFGYATIGAMVACIIMVLLGFLSQILADRFAISGKKVALATILSLLIPFLFLFYWHASRPSGQEYLNGKKCDTGVFVRYCYDQSQMGYHIPERTMDFYSEALTVIIYFATVQLCYLCVKNKKEGQISRNIGYSILLLIPVLLVITLVFLFNPLYYFLLFWRFF